MLILLITYTCTWRVTVPTRWCFYFMKILSSLHPHLHIKIFELYWWSIDFHFLKRNILIFFSSPLTVPFIRGLKRLICTN